MWPELLLLSRVGGHTCSLRGTVERAADGNPTPPGPTPGWWSCTVLRFSVFARSWVRSRVFALTVTLCLSSPHAGFALHLLVASGSFVRLHPDGLKWGEAHKSQALANPPPFCLPWT